MKKQFNAPKLKQHGALQEITQAFGSSSASDTVFFNGRAFGNATGSQDGNVIPK